MHLWNCCTVGACVSYDEMGPPEEALTWLLACVFAASAVSAYEKNLAVEGFTSGFQVIFLVAAVVSAIACLISLPIKSSPLKKEKPQEKENEEDDGSVDASSEKDEEEK